VNENYSRGAPNAVGDVALPSVGSHPGRRDSPVRSAEVTVDVPPEVEILLVEDNPDDARFVEHRLRGSRGGQASARGGGPIEITAIERAETLSEGLDQVNEGPPDAVLLDLRLPDSSGLATVDAMVDQAPRVPIVVLTGRDDEIGVAAIRRGAQDYLVKGDIGPELIRRSLRYAIERERNQRELRDRTHRLALLNRIVQQDLRNDVSMIVGRADQLRGSVAPADEPVLEALLDAAGHAVDLVDTAGEAVDALASDGVEPARRDLDAVLDAAVARLRSQRDAEVTLRWPEERPESVTVYGSTMLESTFAHLLTTAVDHAEDGAPEVTVAVDASDDSVSVSISQSGRWLSESGTELLADPDSAVGDAAGIGVGLYLVWTVLEAAGGDVVVEEAPDGDTTVTVRLERVSPG